MGATVADIMVLMNRIAPLDLAEDWDNCGLQAGAPGQEVKKVMVALDPSYAVVSEACRGGFDLLVTHHPLFIRPLQTFDFSRMPGKALAMAARFGLSIFSAHTNMDSAQGGLNDMCAELLDIRGVSVLSGRRGDDYVKLVFFVPVEQEEKLLDVLAGTSAGTLGRYAACSFSVRGVGRFKPLEGASPHTGRIGEIASVNEVRIESIVARRDVADVVAALRAAHPYETMAYDIFPLDGGVETGCGLGRVGELESEMAFSEFVKYAMERFGTDTARVAGDPGMAVRRVAVCSGGGSSLLGDFLASGADVYVSGDLKYHDATAVLEAGKGLVDLGHFATEHIVVDLIAEKLEELVDSEGLEVGVFRYTGEREPYVFIDRRGGQDG